MNSYKEQYDELAANVNSELDRLLPEDGSKVTEAMRYSLLGGGKRLRGVLILAVCDHFDAGITDDALKASAAIEMLHCYSLIHDDLPCMDDDDLRRGKPSCHVAYGEAMAMLAGDGLLTEAFRVISSMKDTVVMASCLKELSEAAGHEGMILGQELDLTVPEEERDAAGLDRINDLKTGRLIRAAVRMGCACAGVKDRKILKKMDRFADKFGRAFQITDDILDVISTDEELGKTAGSDARNGKVTYASEFGLLQARTQVMQLVAEGARDLIGTVDSGIRLLGWMIAELLERSKSI